MTGTDPAETGRRLAERHAEAHEVDPTTSLLNYAEAPHTGDWTLRSALVRIAQSDPPRVGAVLEPIRRLDAALHHVARLLERHGVRCDRSLAGPDGLDGEPVDPYPDARTADLARLVASGVDADRLLSGYEEAGPLEHEERMAIPLLVVAVGFDALASELAVWADERRVPPPLDRIDEVHLGATEVLDALGVPVETGPPPGFRRGGRG